MENKIGKRPFPVHADFAYTGCFIMAYLRIAGNGCSNNLHQQHGAGNEFDPAVF